MYKRQTYTQIQWLWYCSISERWFNI